MSQELTIALANFDRHMPFFMNWLPPASGFHLRALDVGINPPGRDGGDRHGRMLVDGEFDVAEVSLASYIMARSRGAPFTAVPVFPRRLFSQNHIYVGGRSGIHSPADLAGRRVAIRAFQVTLSVLAKGDLKSHYGVPWEDIRWVVQEAEQLAWSNPRLNIERMPPGTRGADLLARGEVDAYIDPRPPAAVLDGHAGVRNLFADQREACLDYHRTRGCFPIMHLLAVREDTARRFPHLPAYLMEAWEDAQVKTRRVYEDYAYTAMPFGRLAWQDDQRRFGADLWSSGLAANADNLRWFMDYLVDQTLLDKALPIPELFHPSVQAT